MTTWTLIIGLLALGAFDHPTEVKNIYDFHLKNIDGKEISLRQYAGKVLLIVNTASLCGYTPQYEGLEKLYKEYKDQGFVILGFPANNFGQQEPGTNTEIKQFCQTRFSVTFPIFSKVSVKGGDQSPLFKYLTSEQNPNFTGEIKWNFEKFLIGKDGKLLHRFRSEVTPGSNLLTAAVDKALLQK